VNSNINLEKENARLLDKNPNRLLSVFILLITVTPSPVVPPMNYPVKDNPTTPKQAS
jgi:hypothetical protein